MDDLRRRLHWGHTGFRVANRPAAVLCVSLLLLIPAAGDIRAALRCTGKPVYSDLATYHRALISFTHHPGRPVYTDVPEYLYPPFFLALLGPLFKLPLNYAVAGFQVLKWVALLASLWLAWRLCSPPDEDLPPVVALGSFLFTARFLANDMGNGNINVFLLLAVLAAALQMVLGRPLLAGLVLAPAVALKLSPALLVLYFVYKGWWRSLVGVAVGVVFCLVLWPALAFGWDTNWRDLTAWYQHVVAGYLGGGEVWSVHLNQSLPALVNRLLGPGPALEPNIHLAPLALPPWALRAVRLALALGVLGGLAYVCRRRLKPAAQPLAFAAEIGLVQIAMLLLSGYSWKAHYVGLLLPLSVLLAYLADARYPDAPRKWVKRVLWVALALNLASTDLVTPRGSDYAEACGAVLWCAVAAGAGLVLIRRATGVSAKPAGPCSP